MCASFITFCKFYLDSVSVYTTNDKDDNHIYNHGNMIYMAFKACMHDRNEFNFKDLLSHTLPYHVSLSLSCRYLTSDRLSSILLLT